MWSVGVTKALGCVGVVLSVSILYEVWTGGSFFTERDQLPFAFQEAYHNIYKCGLEGGNGLTKELEGVLGCFISEKMKLESISKQTFNVISQEQYSNCLNMVPLVSGDHNVLNVIKSCTINTQKLDESISDLRDSVSNVKVYALIITIGNILYLVYSYFSERMAKPVIKAKAIKKVQINDTITAFKNAKPFIHTPGVIVQKVSSYHSEGARTEQFNPFKSPKYSRGMVTNGNYVNGQNMFQVNPMKYTAEVYQANETLDSKATDNVVKDLVISTDNASTPKKKKIDSAVIESVKKAKVGNSISTNNILEGLDNISLELTESLDKKEPLSEVPIVGNKKIKNKDTNTKVELNKENIDENETISVNSNPIAEKVALTVIGDKYNNGGGFLSSNLVNKSSQFVPYSKQSNFNNGWSMAGSPTHYNANISPVRRVSHIPPTIAGGPPLNGMPQMIPMSNMGQMHHINQVNVGMNLGMNGPVAMNPVPSFYNNNHNVVNNMNMGDNSRRNIW